MDINIVAVTTADQTNSYERLNKLLFHRYLYYETAHTVEHMYVRIR